jgi:hypothetical protein
MKVADHNGMVGLLGTQKRYFTCCLGSIEMFLMIWTKAEEFAIVSSSEDQPVIEIWDLRNNKQPAEVIVDCRNDRRFSSVI